MKNKLWIVVAAVGSFRGRAAERPAGPARHGAGKRPPFPGAWFAHESFIPVRLLLKAKDKIGVSAEQEKRLGCPERCP